MKRQIKFVDKYEHDTESLLEKLRDLTSQGGPLAFLGEKNTHLLLRGIANATNTYGTSPQEIAESFASRLTQSYRTEDGDRSLVPAFLAHPEKSVKDVALALTKAGVIEGVPDFGEVSFPEGCFVSLARRLQSSLPGLPEEAIIFACEKFEDKTFLGKTDIEVGYTPQDVDNWLESASEHEVFESWLLNKYFEVLDDDPSSAWDMSYQILKKVQDAFYLDEDMEEIFRDCVYEHITERHNLSCSDRLNLNLLLTYGDELNSDMSNIEVMASMLAGQDVPDEEVVANNALTWLIHQQGYTLKDLIEKKESVFLDSVREELANFDGGSAYLTVCCHADVDVLSDMKIRERAGGPLDLDPDVTVGLFSPDRGGGSILGITLDRPLIIPQEMIANIQVEKCKPSFGYTVDDTYGMSPCAWKAELGPAATSVAALTKLDISEDMQALQEIWQAAQPDGPSM